MLLCFPLLAGWVTMGLAPLDKVNLLSFLKEYKHKIFSTPNQHSLCFPYNPPYHQGFPITSCYNICAQVYIFYIARLLQGLGVMSSVTQVENFRRFSCKQAGAHLLSFIFIFYLLSFLLQASWSPPFPQPCLCSGLLGGGGRYREAR